MKKKAVQYTIAEPCHEKWNAMTASEQGRFCNSCQKTVVDFTRMTDRQVLDYMSKAAGSVCGRMTDRQLNRSFTSYDVQQTRSFSLQALVLGTAISAFSALNTYGQHKVGKMRPVKGEVQQVEVMANQTTEQSGAAQPKFFSGKVIDFYTSGGPVADVSVTIYNPDGLEIATTLTNENGEFKLPFDETMEPFTVIFRKIAYQEAVYLFTDMLTLTDFTVELQPEEMIIMGLMMPEPVEPPVEE